MDDHVHSACRAYQALRITHVANQEPKAIVVCVPLLQLRLLQFVAAVESNRRWTPSIQNARDQRLAEGARRPVIRMVFPSRFMGNRSLRGWKATDAWI